MNEDNQKRKKDGKKLKDDRIMLIMDDCMSSKGEWLKDPQILELFFEIWYIVSANLSLISILL